MPVAEMKMTTTKTMTMATRDVNLRQRFGVQLHTPEEVHYKKVMRDLHIRQHALTPTWNYFERQEGVYDFNWFDGIIENSKKYTGNPPFPPLCWIFKAPAWIDTSLKPRGEPDAPHVPYLPVDKIPQWRAAVRAIVTRYSDYIKYWNVDTETNVNGAWNGIPEEYATSVVIPAAEEIHALGGKLVAPGITIQKFESDAHYARAKDHMMKIMRIARDHIDITSIHSYGKSAYRVIQQIISFVRECGLKYPIWITETGFPETWYWRKEDWEDSLRDLLKTGQQRQLDQLKELLPYAERTSWIGRWYYWRGFDVRDDADKHSTNGLLDWRLRPKLAGLYVKEQMKEDMIR